MHLQTHRPLLRTSQAGKGHVRPAPVPWRVPGVGAAPEIEREHAAPCRPAERSVPRLVRKEHHVCNRTDLGLSIRKKAGSEWRAPPGEDSTANAGMSSGARPNVFRSVHRCTGVSTCSAPARTFSSNSAGSPPSRSHMSRSLAQSSGSRAAQLGPSRCRDQNASCCGLRWEPGSSLMAPLSRPTGSRYSATLMEGW